jgi:hypothetical protein
VTICGFQNNTQKFNSFKVVFKKINLSFKLEGGLGVKNKKKWEGREKKRFKRVVKQNLLEVEMKNEFKDSNKRKS